MRQYFPKGPDLSVHTAPDLEFVAGLCDGSSSVVMAGDFNSTLDHWAALGVDGGDLGTCRDAASAVGAGAGALTDEDQINLGKPVWR